MLFDSPLISRGSGSVGGLTFSRNRSGNYIRARTNPVNPNTPQQQAVRSAVADLSNLWINTLTQADRDKWEDYAANVPVTNPLGASIFLTGINQYVRSNVPRIQAGLARLDVAPSIFDIGSFTAVGTVAAASGNQVAVSFTDTDDWATATGGAMLVWIARPVSETINFFKGPYRFAGSILGDDTTPPTSPAVITSDFAFEAGQKIFTRIRVTQADGRLSADARDFSIAV